MKIIQGDCVQVLKQLEDNSIDSVCCDPPYGLEFMGKEWDKFKNEDKSVRLFSKDAGINFLNNRPRFESNPTAFQDFCYEWAKECLRVLKPGGHLLSFGGTRTYHRMAVAIEDAGFEVRNQLIWAFGQGFPKSLNFGRALLKDIERELRKQGIKNITWK